MKKFFSRLKNFFSRVKAAIVELFTGKEPEKEETPKASDGEVVKATVVKKHAFWEWVKSLGEKIGKFFKREIEDFCDNPTKGIVKLTATSGALTIVFGAIDRIVGLFKPARKPEYNMYADPRMYYNGGFRTCGSVA